MERSGYVNCEGAILTMQTADQPSAGPRISVRGADGLSAADLRELVRRGAKCVRFEYCVSVVFATFRCESAVYFTDSWQERYLRGLPFSVLSLLLGPWGVPWGPVVTAQSVWANLSGGRDMTAQILADLDVRDAKSL